MTAHTTPTNQADAEVTKHFVVVSLSRLCRQPHKPTSFTILHNGTETMAQAEMRKAELEAKNPRTTFVIVTL